MKKYLMPFIVLFLLAGTSCQEKIDVEKEKEAIKAVIEEETNGFCARDFDRMAATYVQDETLYRLGASKSGYSYYAGWEELSPIIKEFLEENPEPANNPEVKTNYRIKVYQDCAWAVYDNEAFNTEGEVSSKSIHVQFPEKVEGEWKIVFFSIVNTTSYEGEAEEGEGEGETEEPETEDTE